MKTRTIFILAILIFANNLIVCSQSTTKSCTITYVANEGFLVEASNKKILIDALFGGIKGNWCDQPSDSVSNLMLKGLAPFDNINLVLVTHKHSDHFNETKVVEFLKNNPNSRLVCPFQINEKLKNNSNYSEVSERVTSLISQVPFDSLLHFDKLNVRVLRLNHGSYFEKDSAGNSFDLHRDIENFGYLIDIDGFRLLHTGDGSPSTNKELYKNYGLGNKELDVAFLDRVFLGREGQELMSEVIRSKNIVFMHIEPGKRDYYKSIVKSVPEMFVFQKSMEKRVIFK